MLDLSEVLEKFDPVLGFEIHVELNTKTKMFCGCPNVFGKEPNVNVCPICLGLPGALPKVNVVAVESAIKIGLALGCKVMDRSSFARKNYFYPDTPKNFQTSQYEDPICYDGMVEVELDDGKIFEVEIERVHMEEDAGKLTHLGGAGGRIQGAAYSLLDYNRAGVPLIEIVTKPIEGALAMSPQLGRKYLATIRDIVVALGVSEGRMEQGQVRCDANVSLRLAGEKKFGTRSETKNMNSFRAVEKAITYELSRQGSLLSAGKKVVQETRHWHEDTSSTTSGRPKSDADDYRYFPEPDLVPVVTDSVWLEKIKQDIPELPGLRRRRLQQEWEYTDFEFRDVLNAGVLEIIAETIRVGVSPAAARKWWMGELVKRAKSAGVKPIELGVSAQMIMEIEQLIAQGTLNDRLARQALDGFLEGEGSLQEVIVKRNLQLVVDDSALVEAVTAALGDNPEVVAKIRAGKVAAAGAVVGAVMRTSGGKFDPSRVRELVLELSVEQK